VHRGLTIDKKISYYDQQEEKVEWMKEDEERRVSIRRDDSGEQHYIE
jgi:hypothetical protein